MKHLASVLLVSLWLALPGVGYAALEDYFVSTAWLADRQDQVVVVDVRKGPLYHLGHISGALHVERSEFLETRGGVKSLVPTSAGIVELLSRLGVTPETTVVAYAEDDNPYAARFVWTLRYHGHSKSYLLDGGYDKWQAEGRSTKLLGEEPPRKTRYALRRDAEYLEARADADYIYTRLDNPGMVIWDTRRAGEHQGSEVRAERGGHIPGAVHFDWTELQTEVNGVKVLKAADQIVKLLEAKGLTAEQEIVAHCQTGIRSSYATLVLLGLGYEKVKNYDGSWIEWANNPSLPIVNAEGKLESSPRVSMD